jgi:hypothetical protein
METAEQLPRAKGREGRPASVRTHVHRADSADTPFVTARSPSDSRLTRMNPDIPYLSVVIASRNDGYASGMLRRIQVCVDSFVEQLERFDFPSELILVDWNPPEGRGLWNALRWPKFVRQCTIRLITVPPKLHARLPFADRLPILIHRARNVGIRRARGEFVLPTSPDILLSDELAEWFGTRQMDPARMYRVPRYDVPEKAIEYDSHEQRLIYCRDHVHRIHDRGESFRMQGLPELFTNASGDFTLLSRDMYLRLHGIPEEREFHSMHFDSVFCFMANAAGATEVELTAPLRMYHVDHGAPSWRPRASWLERAVTQVMPKGLSLERLIGVTRRIAPPQSTMDRLGVPHLDCSTMAGAAQYEALIRRLLKKPNAYRYNDASWGLGRYSLEERVLGPAPARR